MKSDVLAMLAEEYRRQRQSRAPEWDAVAAGELDVADAIGRTELDAEQRDRARQLFSPLGADFDHRIADRLADASSAAAPEEHAPADPTDSDARDSGRSDPARTPDSSWGRRLAVAALAVAAVVALVVLLRPPTGHGDADPSLTPELPSYEAVVLPGAAAVRGAEDGSVPTLTAGAEFGLLLRPAVRHAHVVHVTVCLVRDDEAFPVDVDVAPASPGETLDARGRVPASTAPGRWTLRSSVSLEAGVDACSEGAAPSSQRVPTVVDITRD